MFSPSPKKDGSKAPAKTPGGWARALGIFSTAKKPPPPSPAVGSGTEDTGGMMNGDISAETQQDRFGIGASSSSGLNNSVSSETEPFMSPITPPNTSPGTASGLVNQNSNNNSSIAAGGGSTTTPRLNFDALSSRTSTGKANPTTAAAAAVAHNQIVVAGGDQMTLRNAKSPWQSRQNNATAGFNVNLSTKSPWQGSRSRRSRSSNNAGSTKQLTFLSSSVRDRRRQYRPNAIVLNGGVTIGRRFPKAGGECRPEEISQALAQMRDTFLVPQNQDTSTNVYAVRGKVQWGSSSRPNRLPRPSQKRQRSFQEADEAAEDHHQGDDEGHESTSRKRRKKVQFNREEDGAVVTTLTATPFASRSTAANRKGTPHPSRTATTTTTTGDSYVSPTMMSGREADTQVPPPSASRPDKLPPAPQRMNFPFGSLDSDEPISLDFSTAPKPESFDAVQLDATGEKLHFSCIKESPTTISEAARSFNSKIGYDATRYVRPPSPVRGRPNPKRSPQDDDGGYASQKPAKKGKFGLDQDDQDEGKAPDWVCDSCNKVNDADETKCSNCGALRKADPKAKEQGWAGIFNLKNEGRWQCRKCSLFNDDNVEKCKACDGEKGAPPDALPPEEGKENAAAKPSSASKMPAKTSFPASFGSGSAKNNFSFGGGSSTPSLPVPSGKPQDNQFSFPSTTGGTNGSSTPGFVFGGASVPAAGSSSGGEGFKFNSTSTPAPAGGSGFVFGGGGAKTSNGDDEKKEGTGFVFGGTPAASTPAPAPQTGGFKFTTDAKASAPAPATEGKKTTPLSASAQPFKPFNSASGENGDKKPAPTGGFGFGMGGTDNGANKTNGVGPGPAFGAIPSKTSDESKAAASTPAAAPAPPPFSSSFSSTPAAPPAAFSFGGGSKSDTKPASSAPAPPFVFGSTPAPETDGGKSANSAPFGSSTVAPPVPAPKSDRKPKRQRGYDINGTKSAEPKAPKAPTDFGAPAPAAAPAPATAGPSSSTTPAPGPAPFAFGGGKNETDTPAAGSTFGNAPAPSAPFGNPVPPSAGGGMPFGSPAGTVPTPAPGATSNFTFGGGSTAPTPAPPPAASGPTPGGPMFGGGAGAPAFGNTPAPSTGFGSGSTPAATTFGAAPAPAAMNFGSTPAAPAMNFGSTPAAPSGGGMSFPSATAPTPAAFGSTAAPAPGGGGFSFGAAPAFGSAKPPAATPGAPAFGSNPAPAAGFAFGAQAPAAPAPAFNSASFGSNATPNTGGFGASSSGGFGQTPAAGGMNFGAPQTGGFQSTTTPAASGGFGGGGFGAPQTAPPQQGGFAMGTSNPVKKGRRVIRAKRPTRPA